MDDTDLRIFPICDADHTNVLLKLNFQFINW